MKRFAYKYNAQPSSPISAIFSPSQFSFALSRSVSTAAEIHHSFETTVFLFPLCQGLVPNTSKMKFYLLTLFFAATAIGAPQGPIDKGQPTLSKGVIPTPPTGPYTTGLPPPFPPGPSGLPSGPPPPFPPKPSGLPSGAPFPFPPKPSGSVSGLPRPFPPKPTGH